MRDERALATQATSQYLVDLLCDYAKPTALTDETLSRPLTLLLAEAHEARGSERFERLRVLGDGALFIGGFFSEHLETRGVALHYVSSVGARAYDGAALMLRRAPAKTPGSPPDVFRELADNFTRFVDLLSRVADALLANAATTNRAVLKLYERWLRTGSDSLARALQERGLLPLRGDGMLH
jgi:hypothetical protein